MKIGTILSAALLLLVIEVFAVAAASSAHAGYRHYGYRHYGFWRIGPNLCFLPPDVIVAVNALGPYCSSPRGYYAHRQRF